VVAGSIQQIHQARRVPVHLGRMPASLGIPKTQRRAFH
jgi:hypothetical protein